MKTLDRVKAGLKAVGSRRWPFFALLSAFPLAVAVYDIFFFKETYEGTWLLPPIAAGVFAVMLGAGLWAARRKQCEALLPAPVLWWLAALAVVYMLVGDAHMYNDLRHVGITLLAVTGFLCLLWALFRHGALVVWFAALLVGLVQIVAYHKYCAKLNSLVLQEAMEAKEEEIMAYLSFTNVSLAVLAAVFVGALVWLQVRLLRRRPFICTFNTGCLCCLTAMVFGSAEPGQNEETVAYWPFSEFYRIAASYQEAVESNFETVQLVMGLPSPAEKESSISTLHGKEGVVVILHIGESVRADHLGINGYHRNTTPWLLSQRGNGLINFTDCTAAAFLTCQSQIVILTDARRDLYEKDPAMVAHVGSVLDLFDANGFELYSFLGWRPGLCLKHDRVLQLLCSRARKRFTAPGPPWTAVDQIKGVLSEHPDDNLVLLINNEGSHVPFEYYDKDNPPFTPLDDTFSDPKGEGWKIVNAYDSTIHYTDEYIRRVVEALRTQKRPFVYLYVSDHGECFGEEGGWGRSCLFGDPMYYFSTTACHVGMFAIYSPEFERLNGHFTEAVHQLAAHADMPVGHEHIFHTLLGLVGIKSEYYNPELDLCSPEAKPYSGPHWPRKGAE